VGEFVCGKPTITGESAQVQAWALPSLLGSPTSRVQSQLSYPNGKELTEERSARVQNNCLGLCPVYLLFFLGGWVGVVGFEVRVYTLSHSPPELFLGWVFSR
jgi:hypothetical protein